jgi:hypothetical protein
MSSTCDRVKAYRNESRGSGGLAQPRYSDATDKDKDMQKEQQWKAPKKKREEQKTNPAQLS